MLPGCVLWEAGFGVSLFVELVYSPCGPDPLAGFHIGVLFVYPLAGFYMRVYITYSSRGMNGQHLFEWHNCQEQFRATILLEPGLVMTSCVINEVCHLIIAFLSLFCKPALGLGLMSWHSSLGLGRYGADWVRSMIREVQTMEHSGLFYRYLLGL